MAGVISVEYGDYDGWHVLEMDGYSGRGIPFGEEYFGNFARGTWEAETDDLSRWPSAVGCWLVSGLRAADASSALLARSHVYHVPTAPRRLVERGQPNST